MKTESKRLGFFITIYFPHKIGLGEKHGIFSIK